MSDYVKPYMADIAFLQPVIDAYNYGAFEDKGLPGRVMNALDSLSWYGDVRITYQRSAPPLAVKKKRKPYTKASPYWQSISTKGASNV